MSAASPESITWTPTQSAVGPAWNAHHNGLTALTWQVAWGYAHVVSSPPGVDGRPSSFGNTHQTLEAAQAAAETAMREWRP